MLRPLPSPDNNARPVASGTRIGHVHLKVADLDRALGFYCGVLGFSLMQRYGSEAAFISAGGYHHHIGLNTWESRGGSPPPPGTTGLYHTAILYPTRGELADALRRVAAAGIQLDGASDHGVSEALYLRDPDQNGVELYWDRPRENWPVNEQGELKMSTRRLDLDVCCASRPPSSRQSGTKSASAVLASARRPRKCPAGHGMNPTLKTRNARHRLTAMLRMRQLELISTLADAGNMRAAAQRLNISTAAVSKGLLELEALFEVEIFRRLPRGVVPTSSGALIVQRARLLLNDVTQLSDDVAARRAGGGESLTLGAPPFIAWTLLPRLLRDMADHGRTPSVTIVEGRLAEIGRQLETGEIDALITMNTPSELGGLKLDGFKMEQVDNEQWRVVCAPGHPLAQRGRVAVRSWKDVAHADWILPPRPTNARIMAEQVMLKHGLPPIVPHIESTNAITNLQLAERGLGITLVAMCVVEDRLRRGLLIEIPMQDLPPPVPIVMVYRSAGARDAAIARLLAAVQRLRKAATSARSSSSARTRKLAARKSRS